MVPLPQAETRRPGKEEGTEELFLALSEAVKTHRSRLQLVTANFPRRENGVSLITNEEHGKENVGDVCASKM